MSPVVIPVGEEGVKRIAILRSERDVAVARDDAVAVEEPLEIQLSFEKRGIRATKSVSVTMRTPGHDRELAAGFLFTEGIIDGGAAIEGWELPESARSGPAGGNSLRAVLRDGVAVDLRALERHFYTTSSCGVCGKTSLEALRVTGRIALEPDRPVWDSSRIGDLPQVLRSGQAIFEATGGLHAAGLFDADGALVAVREDVGRHNAVDKLVGAQVLAGRVPLAGHLLLVSGRASFELVQKAVMAGIPVLASVGAPSSLAVDVARQFGATLLGFVARGRFNVYAGAQRIRFPAP
ncbi:MAG TPA: formate dehydrogenase accessory sulfurtransferase FdhD [Opitutaceae bacterium]